MNRPILVFILAGAALPACGQNYPVKTIRIVVGYPAGGGSDLAARLVARELSERIGQQVIVDNRPGATGLVANELVAKSAPDGYTLLLANSSFSYIPAMYGKFEYDMKRDFAPVALVGNAPYVLITHPSVPAGNIRELVALAKSQPGKLNYGSGGSGGSSHLAMELLKSMTGANILHIPYNGNAPAMTATLAGEVDMTMTPIPPALPFVQVGKTRALATTGEIRSEAMRNVPTVAESGIRGYECGSWFGFMAPARTPPEIIQKLSDQMLALAKSRDFQEKLMTNVGADPMAMSAKEFAQFFAQDIEKWGKIIKSLGIKGD